MKTNLKLSIGNWDFRLSFTQVWKYIESVITLNYVVFLIFMNTSWGIYIQYYCGYLAVAEEYISKK